MSDIQRARDPSSAVSLVCTLLIRNMKFERARQVKYVLFHVVVINIVFISSFTVVFKE